MKKERAENGRRTRELLEFLKIKGPQTRNEIEHHAGVHMCVHLARALSAGQISKIRVIRDPDGHLHIGRRIWTAYKHVKDSPPKAPSWKEKEAARRLSGQIEKSVKFLQGQGYSVLAPTGPAHSGYWYCPNCQEEIDSSRVTFQELHDACGHPASWIEPKTN